MLADVGRALPGPFVGLTLAVVVADAVDEVRVVPGCCFPDPLPLAAACAFAAADALVGIVTTWPPAAPLDARGPLEAAWPGLGAEVVLGEPPGVAKTSKSVTVPVAGRLAVGCVRSTPPSRSSGDPERLTGAGELARTWISGLPTLRPTPVITAATVATNQNASIGRAWFAFTVTLSPRCGAVDNRLLVGLPRPRTTLLVRVHAPHDPIGPLVRRRRVVLATL